MVKPISPYLLRPLRTLEEALRELGHGSPEAPPDTPAEPLAGAPGDPSSNPGNPKDSITIGGKDVPVAPAEPTPAATGGQVDIKA